MKNNVKRTFVKKQHFVLSIQNTFLKNHTGVKLTPSLIKLRENSFFQLVICKFVKQDKNGQWISLNYVFFYKLLISNKIHLPTFLIRPSLLSVIKRPTDSTASTTSGQTNDQTSTTREETDTTSRQTSTTSGQRNTTSG